MKIKRNILVIVILLVFLLINRVNSSTESNLEASLGLLNSAPVLYGELEPTDPIEYAPETSYQFQININDVNGADTIDTVFFEWNGVNDTVTSYSGINSTVRQYTTTKIDIAAGTYDWKWYANDTNGDCGNIASGDYTVSKNKTVLILSNNTASINTSGLIAYWRFEEGSSSPVDYSGWDNDGSLQGGLDCTGNAGRFGNGCDFSTDDSIEITHSNFLEMNGIITVSAWINPNSFTGTPIILGYNNDSYTNTMLFGFDTSGHMCLWVDSNVCSEYIVSTSKWTYITWVFDQSSNNVDYYINGSLQDSDTITPDTVYSNGQWYIGAECDSGPCPDGNYFSGTIDEFMIFNRSLTANEISEFYESRVTYGTATTFNATELNTRDLDVTYELFRNTTQVNATENGTVMTLPASYNYYMFNTSGGQNYTKSSILLPLNITKATPQLSLSANPSWSENYAQETIVTGSETNIGDGECSYSLYRNDSYTGMNPETIILPAGNWNYTYNTSGCENYTSNETAHILAISKISSTIDLLLNGTDGDKTYNVSDIINSTIELTTDCGNTTGDQVFLDTNITANWIIDQGPSPFENMTSTLTVGKYNFTGYWDGNENCTSSSEIHYVTINQPAYLEVSLVTPPPTLSVTKNQTFTVNATILCRNGYCGDVEGIVQYNGTSAYPDTPVNATTDEIPLFIHGSPQVALKSCPTNPLAQDEFCNLTWTINATGAENSQWDLGVLFNTSTSGIDDNHTDNSTITITHCSCDITLWSPATIEFELLNPGTNQNPATGNSGMDYNITVNQGSCTSNLWTSGEDLTNSTYGTSIGIGNLTWGNLTNNYTMTSDYTTVKRDVIEFENVTNYYWINISAVKAGRYRGNITIYANESS